MHVDKTDVEQNKTIIPGNPEHGKEVAVMLVTAQAIQQYQDPLFSAKIIKGQCCFAKLKIVVF